MMILTIVCIFALICFYDVAYATCAYFAIRLLIPAQIRMIGVNSSLNTFLLFILLIFCIKDNYKHLYFIYKSNAIYFKCISGFFILLLLGIPFGIVSLKDQFSELLQMIITEVMPSVCIILAIKDKKSFNYLFRTFILCTLITTLYGIFSYYIKSNPYYMYWILNYGDIDSISKDFSEITKDKGALVGYAAGMSTGGGLGWSQIVLASTLFFICLKKEMASRLYVITILLLFINCFLTGQRSALLSLIIAVIYINKSSITSKKLVACFSTFLIVVILFETFPALENFKKNIYSTIIIWDDEYARFNDMRGSNFEMRMDQLEATLNSLIESPMGKGISYYKIYHEKYGGYGVMKGFESIFFKVGWESGLIGFAAWLLLFIGCVRYSSISGVLHMNNKAFFIGYISTIILTGIQGTLYLFLVFVVLLHKYYRNQSDKQIFQKNLR